MSEKKTKNFLQLAIRFDKTCKYGHTLFIKEHVVRNMDEKQSGSTILVLNIPPYCNEECLRRIFCKCGKIVEVHEQKNPGKFEEKDESRFFGTPPVKGFHVAYIKFKSKKSLSSVEKFVKQTKTPIYLSEPENEIPVGIKKMCLDYISTFPDFSELEDEINTYMQNYDSKVEQKEIKEKRIADREDEDGWVTVTKSGKQPSFSRTEAGEIKLRTKLKRKQEKEKGFNIYNYQIREAKRSKIIELRNKFEEDKRKVEAMKQARKFKPF